MLESKATWEDEATLHETFPHINLEDKVVLGEVGNDTLVKNGIEPEENDGAKQLKEPMKGRPERKKRAPIWMQDFV